MGSVGIIEGFIPDLEFGSTPFQPHCPNTDMILRVSSQEQVGIQTLCSFIPSPELSFSKNFQYKSCAVVLC